MGLVGDFHIPLVFFLGCLILQGSDFDFPLTLQVSLEMGHCPKRIGYNDMYIMGI